MKKKPVKAGDMERYLPLFEGFFDLLLSGLFFLGLQALYAKMQRDLDSVRNSKAQSYVQSAWYNA